MKIGKQADPNSAISASNAGTIVIRGLDLCKELIGRFSFTDHFFLLLTGRLPTEAQRRVLDATLVAIAEHGLVPSVQASRMTFAAAPEAMQGAVAAGILGSGSVILGSSEAAGRLLAQIVSEASGEAARMGEVARAVVDRHRREGRPVPGYGHPLHKRRDPRVERLLEVAREARLSAEHVAAAREVERILPEVLGKPLVMNVSSAIPAVLLDAGFPLEAMKGVPILARTAALIAHLVEEQIRPIGFVLSEHGEKAIGYDGPRPPGFVPGT
ncbi:MAG TPA: citryl-CoA lyase [Myxococcaceae bacterium]|nr:citryl-CoA lyase [Myxococcaceae bacterium]